MCLIRLFPRYFANRVKVVLEKIISDTQAAFILGRVITDNIVIGHECIHAMKKKRKGKEGLVALKFDMSKAYDRVE